MPASVTNEYTQNFLLSEENLVKIDEIIRTRTSSIENFELVYSVHRVDHALINYDEPSDVTSEQNNLAERIDGLHIQGKTGEVANIDLVFSKKKGVKLRIYLDDRDQALLLAADLKSYINSEILRTRATRFVKFVESRDFFLVAFGAFFIVALIVFWFVVPPPVRFNNVGATDTARLSYLVENARRRDSQDFMFPSVLAPLGLMVLSFILGPVLKLIFLPSAFYWGKEIERYNRRKSIRNQIFWVVIVGFVISIVASFAFAGLSRRVG